MKEFKGVKISDISKINSQEKSDEFKKLVETIDLEKIENYDCSRLNIWDYAKGDDVRDGINIRFSNMVKGFPFVLNGVEYSNSEGAYIVGAYSENNEKCIEIQGKIISERNGYKCKATYRKSSEYKVFIRDDFYSFNIQYMLMVVWNKSLHNEDFSRLLKCIPIDAHIVENTSKQTGKTSTFWGAKNIELLRARKNVIDEVKNLKTFRFKKELTYNQMIESYKINNIGVFVGKNIMGKILKMCSFGLLYNQEPPIDYNLLSSKRLFVLGHPLEFQKNIY